MEILSRHSRSRKSAKDDLKKNDLKKLNQLYTKVYKVFILYKPNVNNYTGINAYICSCMSGQRTNGCCVHVTSVIYFLSYLNHKNQSMLKLPGNHLNNIINHTMPLSLYFVLVHLNMNFFFYLLLRSIVFVAK